MRNDQKNERMANGAIQLYFHRTVLRIETYHIENAKEKLGDVLKEYALSKYNSDGLLIHDFSVILEFEQTRFESWKKDQGSLDLNGHQNTPTRSGQRLAKPQLIVCKKLGRNRPSHWSVTKSFFEVFRSCPPIRD